MRFTHRTWRLTAADVNTAAIDEADGSRFDALLDRVARGSFYLALSLLTLAACFRVSATPPLSLPTAHAGSYVYGADSNEMAAVVNYPTNWPQQQSNWCGVASIQAINAYAYWKAGIPGQNPRSTQQLMYNLLAWQDGGPDPMSPWGLSDRGITVRANISGDSGTDPRALAWGLYTATPYGYYYHNYIYPGWNGVDHAVRNIASDFGANGLNTPITVAVNGGAHSVVISAVQADGDPSLNPNGVTIQQLLVWDPWYGAPTSWGAVNYYNDSGVLEWWPLSSWQSDAKWWGRTYNTSNGYDPDPHTSPGNYYNVPPLPSHWGGNYVTDEQDTIPPGTYSENIALDNNGNPVAHN